MSFICKKNIYSCYFLIYASRQLVDINLSSLFIISDVYRYMYFNYKHHKETIHIIYFIRIGYDSLGFSIFYHFSNLYYRYFKCGFRELWVLSYANKYSNCGA